MGHSPSNRHKEQGPSPVDKAAKPSSPWWPQVVLASVHINKLMIIAKREEPHI